MILKVFNLRLLIAYFLVAFSFLYFLYFIPDLNDISITVGWIIEGFIIGTIFIETRRIKRLLAKDPQNSLKDIVFPEGFHHLTQNYIFSSRILRPLISLSEREESIDYKNLIALEFNRYTSRNAFTRYMIGVLVVLGLLGTFLGLRDALEPLRTFSNSDNDTMNLVRDSFSGISTMFITSILGILGSISIGLVNSWSNLVAHELFIDLEHFIQVEFLPLLHIKRPPKEKLLYEEINTLNRKIEYLFEENVRDLVSSVKTNTEETARHLKEVQQDFFEKLSASDEIFTRKIAENHGIYISELQVNHNMYSNELKDNFNQLTNRLEGFLAKLVSEIERENHELIEQNKTGSQHLLRLLEKTSKSLFDKISGEADIITGRFDKTLTEINQKYQDSTDRQLEQMQAGFERGVTSLIQTTGVSQETFIERQEKILTLQEEIVSKIQKKTADILKEMQSETSFSMTELARIDKNFRETLEKNSGQLSLLLDAAISKITQTDVWLEALREDQRKTHLQLQEGFRQGTETLLQAAGSGINSFIGRQEEMLVLHEKNITQIQEKSSGILQHLETQTAAALQELTNVHENSKELLEKNYRQISELFDSIGNKTAETSAWVATLQADQNKLHQQQIADLATVRQAMLVAENNMTAIAGSFSNMSAEMPKQFEAVFDNIRHDIKGIYNLMLENFQSLVKENFEHFSLQWQSGIEQSRQTNTLILTFQENLRDLYRQQTEGLLHQKRSITETVDQPIHFPFENMEAYVHDQIESSGIKDEERTSPLLVKRSKKVK